MVTELNPDSDWTPDADSGVETIDNRQRECGFLKADNAYIRADIGASGGILPPFCIFTKPMDSESGERGTLHKRNPLAPIPFKEYIGQGYEGINGTEFLLAVEDRWNVTPIHYGKERAFERMVDRGLYDSTEGVPSSEVARAIDRSRAAGLPDDVTHYGEMKSANGLDLLMRAGKTHYDEPWDFIDEAATRGLNKGIGVTQNRSPPVINPGTTRCFIVHPNALGEDKPGIVGFTYLTRVIYTQDTDGEIPKYAQDYVEAGYMDEVQAGEPEPVEEDIAESHERTESLDPFTKQGVETDDSVPATDSLEASGETSEGTENVRDVTIQPNPETTPDEDARMPCDFEECSGSLERLEDESLLICDECNTVHDADGRAITCPEEDCSGFAHRYQSGQVHCGGCGRRLPNKLVRVEAGDE